MPSYPNTDDFGDTYYDDQQYADEEEPKFIPGHAEAYYNKLDEDVLSLVTSKVGTVSYTHLTLPTICSV